MYSVNCTVYSVKDSTDLYCSQHHTRSWQKGETINQEISRFEDPGHVSCVWLEVPEGRWPGGYLKVGCLVLPVELEGLLEVLGEVAHVLPAPGNSAGEAFSWNMKL